MTQEHFDSKFVRRTDDLSGCGAFQIVNMLPWPVRSPNPGQPAADLFNQVQQP